MMVCRTRRVRSAVIIAVLATIGSITTGSEAWAQKTWVGGSGPNWSTAANWSPSGAPTPGSSLVFPSSANTASNNDLPGTLSLNSITISGSGYTISGNPITVTNAPGIELTTAGTATLSMNVTLTTQLLQVADGGTLTLSGVVTAKFIEKHNPGTLVLTNANAIEDIGSQTNCGVIRALHAQALGPTSGGEVTLRDNCTLRIEANTTLDKQFILRGNGAPGTTGVLEVISGVVVTLRIDLQNTAPATISVFNGGTLDVVALPTAIELQSSLTMDVAGTATISRRIIGPNELIKTNTGTLTLNADNTYNGETIIQGGTVFINGTQPNSPVRLAGGTVAGTGTAGTITSTTGGGISPGTTGPGVLSSHTTTMNGSTTFTVQVSPGLSDQLNVIGTVVLNTARLSVSGTLPAGPVIIINNDSSDPVSGIFAGLPQGATVMVNGSTATISYIGGDGNDVVLNPGAVIPPITISPTTLPGGTVGVPYSQTLTATGGVPPYKGSTTGTLPPGLTAAPLMVGQTAIISGTPTAAGTYTFTVIATDTRSSTGSQTYVVTIVAPEPITLSPTTLPDGTVGTSYTQTVTAAGGVPPYKGSVSGGTLPPGLTAAALVPGVSAVVSGTPTAAGTFTFTLAATDTAGSVGSQEYTIVIHDARAPITVAPPTLPNGTVGSAYSQTITATGGTGTYTYATSSGTLPAGLTLDPATGALSGSPTAPGTFNFTVTATDTASNTGSQAYTVVIAAAPASPITLSPPTLPNGTVGSAYSQTITATGGTGTYTYATSSGTLPPGLTLNPATGVLSGSPTAPGTFNFTVTATDTASNTGSQAYTVVIAAVPAPPITLSPETLPGGRVGTPYSESITASGGVGPPYSGKITAGALPPGLTGMVVAGTSATISGTPTQAGSFTFTGTATDAQNNMGNRSYTIVIQAAPVTITVEPPSLPNGIVGVGYSQTVTASGGTGPYTFAVTAGTLPAGLSLSGGGVLSGTPTTAGTSNFTITATDSAGNTGSRAYALTVTATPTPPITLSPATLPDGTVGAAYSQTVTALGGVGSPYTLSITAGTLPPGLTFTAGLLSGTPTTAGAFTFTVTAIDAAKNTGSQAYTVTIQTGTTPPPVTISPATIPNGTVGQSYSQALSASGGIGGPYTFAVTGGTLPAGLSMTTAGVISGTPTAAGPFSFTVTATDAAGNTGTRTYTGSISATPVPVLPWWMLAALAYLAIRVAASRLRNRPA